MFIPKSWVLREHYDELGQGLISVPLKPEELHSAGDPQLMSHVKHRVKAKELHSSCRLYGNRAQTCKLSVNQQKQDGGDNSQVDRQHYHKKEMKNE